MNWICFLFQQWLVPILQHSVPGEDATTVERLRSAGALMVGKTNMHEIGLGVTGLNTHYGTTRNPHHLVHYPGGSSSGSAAAVAAGLCPIALGLDGAGSIRILRVVRCCWT